MGNAEVKVAEIRESRVSKPQYPYSDYENHMKSDIHTLAKTYNFTGRGICKSIPHISKTLELDHVEKHSKQADFSLADTDELWYPQAYPGDEIVFVVYCEVKQEPKPVKRKSKRKRESSTSKPPKVKQAKCDFFLLRYEVANRGLFHVDIDLHGIPDDLQISYDRFIQFCGQKALKYQRCRNTYYDSPVFTQYFKKKKIKWVFERVRGSGPVQPKHLEPITAVGEKEGLNLSGFPKDFDCAMYDRIVVIGKIESQGGSWSNHCVYVEKVELENKAEAAEINPAPVINPVKHPVYPPSSNELPGPPASSWNAFGGPPPSFEEHERMNNPFWKIPQPAMNPSVVAPAVALNADAAVVQKPDPVNVELKQDEDEEKLTETVQIAECVVCMDEIPTHAFIPCGHRCVCEDCSESLLKTGKCPICQAPTTTAIRIYV